RTIVLKPKEAAYKAKAAEVVVLPTPPDPQQIRTFFFSRSWWKAPFLNSGIMPSPPLTPHESSRSAFRRYDKESWFDRRAATREFDVRAIFLSIYRDRIGTAPNAAYRDAGRVTQI